MPAARLPFCPRVCPRARVAAGLAVLWLAGGCAWGRSRGDVAGGAPTTTPLAPVFRADGRAVMHWPSRVRRPLTVWVADPASHPDGRGDDRTVVMDALAAWGDVGLPIRFALVADSVRADVTVGWTDHLAPPLTGSTAWRWDSRGWVTHAHVTLARRHADRTRVEGAELRAIALHELGHALGLGHAADSASVMAPFVVARDLTDADARAARMLYTLPPGRR